MMKKLRLGIMLLLGFSLNLSNPTFAQDDLLKMLEGEVVREKEVEFVSATFKTTRIIHGQSVEVIAPGNLNFLIQHRFGKINDGFQEFFGLDQATIRLGFEYGIVKNLNIGIGRSSFQKTYDGYLKYKMLQQSSGKQNFPMSVVLYTGMAMQGTKWVEPDRVNYTSSRMLYSFQVLLARKFSNALSIQLMPSMIHRNLVETVEDQNDVFAIGAGGRLKISNRISFNAEYYYQLPGSNADKTYNSVAIGFDIETGGHIFQLHVTNSKGMIEPYFISQTAGDISNGDLYFGFNINRVFTLRKQKQ